MKAIDSSRPTLLQRGWRDPVVWKRAAWLGAGAAILGIAQPWKVPDAAEVLTQDAPILEAEGARDIVLSENGQRVLQISAQKIVISSDKRFAIATGLGQGTLFRNDRPFLQLSASRVQVDYTTRDIVADGQVAARGPDFDIQTRRVRWNQKRGRLAWPAGATVVGRGLTFYTPDAFYDTRAQTLHCPQKVEVASERAWLSGPNAVADIKAQRVEIKGETVAVFRPRPGEVPHLLHTP